MPSLASRPAPPEDGLTLGILPCTVVAKQGGSKWAEMSGEPGVVGDRGLRRGGRVGGVVRPMSRRSGLGGATEQGLAARRASAEDAAPSVAFVVPDFQPRAGGAERQTRNQAAALARRGYRVTVVTRRQA